MLKMVSRTPLKASKSKPVKARKSQPAKSNDPAAGSKKPSIDPRHAGFRLVVRSSKIHRWGVYAGEDIPANRKVIEYTGEKISRKETKRRSDAQDKLIYLFTLNNYWT